MAHRPPDKSQMVYTTPSWEPDQPDTGASGWSFEARAFQPLARCLSVKRDGGGRAGKWAKSWMANRFCLESQVWLISNGCLEGCVEKDSEVMSEFCWKECKSQIAMSFVGEKLGNGKPYLWTQWSFKVLQHFFFIVLCISMIYFYIIYLFNVSPLLGHKRHGGHEGVYPICKSLLSFLRCAYNCCSPC